MDASNGYYIATIPAIGCSILALIVMIIFNCQIEGIEVKHEKMKDLAPRSTRAPSTSSRRSTRSSRAS